MRNDEPIGNGRDFVEALIRAGGRRAEPPDDAYQVVFAAAESVWRNKVHRRRWWRVGVLLAAAATGVLAVGLAQSVWRSAVAPTAIATVDRLEGLVERREARARRWSALSAQDVVLSDGGMLRTGPGSGAGLLYPEQLSLRLGADSEIVLTDARRVRLLRGTVYVETGYEGAGHLEIETPIGNVRHLGTQYEVHYAFPGLRIRVREGRVAVKQDAGDAVAGAGDQLTITASGRVERRTITSHDRAWRWTESLAPTPPFDGQPASVLLEWAARETGRELRYVDTATEQRATHVILHGHFGRLSPAEALALLPATTDLDYRLEGDDRITVDAR
jgi:ferric-dicitrate binding protein FerR (iron transport regulator)